MEMAKLADFLRLGIRKELQKTLLANGITEPTPIQEKTIPVVLAGKDVISQAQTGTGKTLAFVLPILEQADPQATHVQALILTPTRELALQITAEVKKLTANLDDIHVLAVYGGQDVDRQMRKLQGKKQVVIATPGRLLDHMRRGTIELSSVSTFVLDEADQMLHMGFLPEVEEIIGNISADRQTLLFSATMPSQVRSLAKRFMKQPEDIRVQGKRITLEDIKQIVVETTDRAKQATLRGLLDEQRPFLAVIFCRTKRRASTLNAALQGYGYVSDELHGDLSQAKREDVMKRFREAKIQYLVATDVAARGLDVEGITHVFNYDIPEDVDSYIHRIGRTGRAGEQGIAFTLVAAKDRMLLEMIEKGINLSLERRGMENEKQTEQKSRNRQQKPEANQSSGRDRRGEQKGRSKGRVDERRDRGFGRKRDGDDRRPGGDKSDYKAKGGPGKTGGIEGKAKGNDRKGKDSTRKQSSSAGKPATAQRSATRFDSKPTKRANATSTGRPTRKKTRQR
ncbi:DEAD/DEAH box helicase [Brevibacillus sp. NRS-1366]|uniref:DEAD/DEAH box helicase n=1 Tax=Brevibacillus sp. NRS-1366 TaxID=3233899 RepID=UPI003D2095CB